MCAELRSACVETDACLDFLLKAKRAWFIESSDPMQPMTSGWPIRDVFSSASFQAVKARHHHSNLLRLPSDGFSRRTLL